MKSKRKIGPLILLFILLIIGTGVGILGLLMLTVILKEFSMIGLIVFIMMSSLSIGFLYQAIDSLKSISVDLQRRELKIGYLGFFERKFIIDEIRGYKPEKFSNGFGSYAGTLIEMKDDRQIHISDFETKNYKELKDEILAFIPRDNQIRLKIWTRFTKFIVVLMVIFIFFMIIYKLVE